MLNRRFLSLLLVAATLLFLTSIFFQQRQSPDAMFPQTPVSVDMKILKGDAIMGKLGNETLK